MDIKISLEIGLSPTLEGFLTRLIGKPQGLGEAVAERMNRAEGDGRERGTKEVHGTYSGHNDDAERGEGPQPEAQRRTRRTKAQMEADAKTNGTGLLTEIGKEDAATGGTFETSASTDAGTASVEVPAGDLAAALGAEAPEGGATKTDVAAKMQEAMAATSPKKVQDRMASDLNGAKRLSEIDPSLYGKAIALYDEMSAGA